MSFDPPLSGDMRSLAGERLLLIQPHCQPEKATLSATFSKTQSKRRAMKTPSSRLVSFCQAIETKALDKDTEIRGLIHGIPSPWFARKSGFSKSAAGF